MVHWFCWPAFTDFNAKFQLLKQYPLAIYLFILVPLLQTRERQWLSKDTKFKALTYSLATAPEEQQKTEEWKGCFKKTCSVFKNFKSHLKTLISQPCEQQPLAADFLKKKHCTNTALPQLVMEDMEEKERQFLVYWLRFVKACSSFPSTKPEGVSGNGKLM